MSERYELARLRVAANAVCGDAFLNRWKFANAAVNWADFKCYCAQRCEDDQGSISYRVIIDEASPDNAEVIRYIADGLKGYGYEGIEIKLEW